ncbi:MAG: hypothetical protein LIP23_09035, partial [Planctomycetes bacterium]|nr:hypothetical protein [Planctomycetota bacterium]
MRTTVIAFCLSLFLCVASRAGTQGRVFLPDLLPQTTIACLVPADNFARNQDFTGSLYQRLASLPDMAAFFESFENSKRLLANDIAQTAQIQPALAMEILDARIGGALLGLNLDRRGEVQAEFVIVLSLASQPSRDTVFSAVMALLNRPEVVAQVLESQGMDPNTPLRSLAQEETLAGYPPMLRIGPSIRIAAIGNLILLYHGQSSESITKIFDAMANPATSLSRLPAFQAAFRGAETEPGMSFTYLNMPRVLSLLDLLNYGSAAKVVEAVGIGSATSLGLAGGYHNEGMRHNLFVYAPGGLRNGLLSALMPMPDGPYGMEAFANILPSTTKSFSSIRFDANVLMAEMPYFLSAIGKSVRPGGVSSLSATETVLGLPLAEIFPTLGADVVVRS